MRVRYFRRWIALLLAFLLLTLAGCGSKSSGTLPITEKESVDETPDPPDLQNDEDEEIPEKPQETTKKPDGLGSREQSRKDKNEDAPADDDQSSEGSDLLTELRQVMREQGDGVGVAYLGFYEKDYDELMTFLMDNGSAEAFPFLFDIPKERFIDCEGGELYLIIPQKADAGVSVCNWVLDESNDYTGGAGDTEYYQSCSGEPFLLKCNISDIMPNTVIYIDVDGGVLEYSPSLSLMDGSLNYPGVYEPGFGVMDLTIPGTEAYSSENREDDWSMQIEELESLAAENILCSWEGLVIPDDGRESHRVFFSFQPDGNMSFFCEPYGDSYTPAVYYEGRWERTELQEPGRPASVYLFDLNRITPDADTAMPDTICTMQFITESYDGISMQIVDGDDLYPNGWEYEVLLWQTADAVG